MNWPWGLLFVVVLLLLWGYGDLVADAQKVAGRVRDMLHRERMAAIEKGLPPPDASFDEALLGYLADGENSGTRARRGRSDGAIGWAIVLVFGGIGWYLACVLTPATGPIGWVRGAGALGLVPVMLGLGLALHTLLLRRQG